MITSISIRILNQLKEQIERLEATQYSERLAVFNGSSIGGHARHIIEFYDCLLGSLETGIVNYDARQRDMQIEQNRDYAISIIKKIIYKYQINNNLEKNIDLEAKFGEHIIRNIATSFQREEVYLIEHTIHHFALIRIGIQTNFPKTTIEKDFGVAFSTLDFRKEKQVIHHS
ncbi:MAG: hypothetical protein RLZZ292_1282 [Bacteroidota bacterium]|jgi:uncharacterized SAM-dependent methyltransferase